MGRLAPDRLERLEEHLLICEHCRMALDETVVYQKAIRAGLARTEELQTPGWFEWLRTPAFAAAAVAVLLAVVVAVFVSRSSTPRVPLAVIELVAVRGDMTVAPPARETEIRLKDAGNSPGILEVVDERGAPVWKGAAPGGLLRIQNPLKEGVYFVRLYGEGKLLHEYGFRVRRN